MPPPWPPPAERIAALRAAKGQNTPSASARQWARGGPRAAPRVALTARRAAQLRRAVPVPARRRLRAPRSPRVALRRPPAAPRRVGLRPVVVRPLTAAFAGSARLLAAVALRPSALAPGRLGEPRRWRSRRGFAGAAGAGAAAPRRRERPQPRSSARLCAPPLGGLAAPPPGVAPPAQSARRPDRPPCARGRGLTIAPAAGRVGADARTRPSAGARQGSGRKEGRKEAKRADWPAAGAKVVADRLWGEPRRRPRPSQISGAPAEF